MYTRGMYVTLIANDVLENIQPVDGVLKRATIEKFRRDAYSVHGHTLRFEVITRVRFNQWVRDLISENQDVSGFNLLEAEDNIVASIEDYKDDYSYYQSLEGIFED